jgi:hypothetical protein
MSQLLIRTWFTEFTAENKDYILTLIGEKQFNEMVSYFKPVVGFLSEYKLQCVQHRVFVSLLWDQLVESSKSKLPEEYEHAIHILRKIIDKYEDHAQYTSFPKTVELWFTKNCVEDYKFLSSILKPEEYKYLCNKYEAENRTEPTVEQLGDCFIKNINNISTYSKHEESIIYANNILYDLKCAWMRERIGHYE